MLLPFDVVGKRHKSRTMSADSLANVRCLLGVQLRSSAGRWRIAEMDVWDNDYLNLIEPAYISFEGPSDGSFVFGTIEPASRHGRDLVRWPTGRFRRGASRDEFSDLGEWA